VLTIAFQLAPPLLDRSILPGSVAVAYRSRATQSWKTRRRAAVQQAPTSIGRVEALDPLRGPGPGDDVALGETTIA
jgi:hypothetical protein